MDYSINKVFIKFIFNVLSVRLLSTFQWDCSIVLLWAIIMMTDFNGMSTSLGLFYT